MKKKQYFPKKGGLFVSFKAFLARVCKRLRARLRACFCGGRRRCCSRNRKSNCASSCIQLCFQNAYERFTDLISRLLVFLITRYIIPI